MVDDVVVVVVVSVSVIVAVLVLNVLVIVGEVLPAVAALLDVVVVPVAVRGEDSAVAVAPSTELVPELTTLPPFKASHTLPFPTTVDSDIWSRASAFCA